MKRILIPLIVVGAVALAMSALAAASGTPAKLKLRKTHIGKIIVKGSGFTVYMFATDKRNQDNCQHITGCLSIWPPVTTTVRVVAGPGVKRSLIGTISIGNGATQVTYAGHPLYGYAGDSRAGQTTYVGVSQFGGRWYALNAKGHKVK